MSFFDYLLLGLTILYKRKMAFTPHHGLHELDKLRLDRKLNLPSNKVTGSTPIKCVISYLKSKLPWIDNTLKAISIHNIVRFRNLT